MQPDCKNYQHFEKLKDGRQTFPNVLPRSHEHVQHQPRLRASYCHGNHQCSQQRKIKMALSDVDVSSSLDHDEEPLAELTDEELYNLVQETL